MNRTPLLNQLEKYRSRFPEEADTVQRFIDFVSSNADCFERSLLMGHVTGSAWLVNTPGSHVLLTHHRKLKRWLQLGGHADGEADVLKVALREANEESGLLGIRPVNEEIFDLDIHLIPARGNEPDHYHYDVRFALVAGDESNYIVSEESIDLDWVDIANISAFSTEESMLRMARKWMNSASTSL